MFTSVLKGMGQKGSTVKSGTLVRFHPREFCWRGVETNFQYLTLSLKLSQSPEGRLAARRIWLYKTG